MSKPRDRILITGANGFVGANLARELIAAGQEVHLLLRHSGHAWRLVGCEGRFCAHQADLRDIEATRQAIDASQPDVIYHLAAHGAYPAQTDRRAIVETNLLGTHHLLQALANVNYRAFVHVGSSSEYGHKQRPMRERDSLDPRTDYALTKAAASLLCAVEARKGKPVTIVRIFSAYGPWEEPSRLVPSVMRACLHGDDPEVGSGNPPRDFVYVGDVVRLLRLAADRPQTRGRVLHAGSGQPWRVRDMVETIVSVSGGRVAPRYGSIPTRRDEPDMWVACIDETSALTGWRPSVDLASGVRKTWSWYCAHALPRAA